MRSGSFRKPKPLEAFDCGSQSTSSVLTSAADKEEARLMAVVVLPTPPFWLATAIMRPMLFYCSGRICSQNSLSLPVKSTHSLCKSWQCSTWNTNQMVSTRVFHMERIELGKMEDKDVTVNKMSHVETFAVSLSRKYVPRGTFLGSRDRLLIFQCNFPLKF